MAKLDPAFVQILRCPASGAALVQDGDWLYTVEGEPARRYPIRDGIAVLLVDEAEPVSAQAYQEVMARQSAGGIKHGTASSTPS